MSAAPAGRGVVVEKPKANIYTALLVLSFVAIVVGCILQRGAAIRSAGGYLRGLTRKAEAGEFSLGPIEQTGKLTPTQQAVLGTASVIGKEFSEPVLARVTALTPPELEDALRALVTSEFSA